MRKGVADDYHFIASDASFLKGVSLLPADLRVEALRRLAEGRGPEFLLELLAQFIGLANSVAENCRTAVVEILIIEGGMHPCSAEKANLPTVFGALAGVELAAKVDQRKTCVGCAFRLGTCANQSPVTTCDAGWSLENDDRDRFMCHLELDEKNQPVRVCAGYAQVKGASGA